MKLISLKISEDIDQRLNELKKKTDMSKNKLINIALARYFDSGGYADQLAKLFDFSSSKVTNSVQAPNKDEINF